MKIGLLGGSFNPIHLGHLAIAEAAQKSLALEEVWFVPTGNHPLKNNSGLLPFDERLQLISKAIEPYSGFKISMLDSNRDNKNYTYNMIINIKSKNSSIDPVFIIGSDILSELNLWFRFEWLLDNVTFAVIQRPGQTVKHTLSDQQFNKLQFLEMKPLPISSTMIRDKIKKDQPITGLVPDTIISDILTYYKALNTII